jgi:ADP-heptose:LPS heptosyltransferase
MHVAASVGAETVGIFGPGSQTRFMPWSEKSNVSSLRLKCAPDQVGSYEAYCLGCIHAENRCMTELRADDVLMKVNASFGASSRGTGDAGDFKD